MVFWMVAAWVMTAADVLFALRPVLPHGPGRVLPTVLVTVGHAVLLLGADQSARARRSWAPLIGATAVHLAGLLVFLSYPQLSAWRMGFNGLIWGAFSFRSAWRLRQAPAHFWRSPLSPAMAFLAHGIFHAVRVLLGALAVNLGWEQVADALQTIGNLEVSFFMVALFVGLLVAHLQQRHEELMSARAEVETLSGLLPICAWCKKVRDDDGYWRQVDDYFSRRSQVRFTHGMCVSCLERALDGERTEGKATG